jgi:hypothetical protein
MPFSAEFRVGRLFETRVDGSLTVEEARAMRTRVWALLGGHSGRVVVFSDWTSTGLFDADVERGMVEMFRQDNAKVERSAIYWGKNVSAFVKQMDQMVTASNAKLVASGRPAVRRGLSDPNEVVRWLGEVLDDAERTRLREVVGRP